LGLAAVLGAFFYADIYTTIGYSHAVIKSSFQVGVLAFAAILLSFTSLYGLMQGVSLLVRHEK
ncbi:MAG: hypothetical protein LBH41_02595, partial [Rickettsiales bacterium]|jgi:hypothetical protein|nr:hypothetical protein [Rickettsiales bacterium]